MNIDDLQNASKKDLADQAKSLGIAGFTAMRKRLVLDLSAAGIDTDNIEGAAWGPRLPNGNATLLLVSDDNFHPQQVNQFLAFEVQRR
jgi:hypothetical protein